MVLLVAGLFFAGCFGAAGPEGEPPGDADAPRPGWVHADYEVVLVNPIGGAGCRAVEMLFEVPVTHAASLLPDGFEPAVSPVTGTNAALTLELVECGSAHVARGEPASMASLLVMVQPPRVPGSLLEFDAANRTPAGVAGQALDFYAVAAYADAQGMLGLLRQSGVPFEPGRVSVGFQQLADLFAVDSRVRGESGNDVVRSVGTAVSAEEFTEHRRVWRLSARGIQLFEEYQHDVGGPALRAFGGVACALQADDLLHPALFPEVCLPLATRVTPAYESAGASYWFHGARI